MREHNATDQRLSIFEPCRELIGPELYARNAFRVLGLAVDASLQTATKNQKLLQMQQRLGLAAAGAAAVPGVLPLTPEPTGDQLRQATEAIQDPVQRLVHAFFWLWPPEVATGETVRLDALATEPADKVLERWQRIGEAGVTTVVVRHNAAVLAHILALDAELGAAQSSGTTARSESSWRWWEATYQHWNALRNEPAFWQAARRLQDGIDDPRLPKDATHRLQEWCAEVILGTTASIFLRRAEQDATCGACQSALAAAVGILLPNHAITSGAATTHAKPAPGGAANQDGGSTSVVVTGHTRLLAKSGWDEAELQAILVRELRPTMDRVRDLAATFSSYGPSTAENQLRETQAALLRAVGVVEALLPEDDPQRNAVLDVAAEALLQVGIALGNEDHDWPRWLRLNDALSQVAAGPALRARLAKTSEALKSLIENSKRESAFEQAATALKRGTALEVEVGSQGMRVPQRCSCCLGPPAKKLAYSFSWEEQMGHHKVRHTVTLHFPVCAECDRHHTDARTKGHWLMVLSVAVAAIVGLMWRGAPTTNPWAVAAGSAVIALLAMAVLAAKMQMVQLDDSHASQGESLRVRRGPSGGATVTFLNPVYAQAFAQANGFPMRWHPNAGSYRGRSPLGGSTGRWRVFAVLLCGMIASAVAFNWGADSRSTTDTASTGSSYTPPSAVTPEPSTTVSTPTWTPPQRTTSGSASGAQAVLSAEIDAGKVRLSALKESAQALEQRLSLLKSDIGSLKSEIENYESTARIGGDVNQYSYQAAIDAHNARVEEYNLVLIRYKRAVAEHNAELERVNGLIDQYNAGLGR